MEVKKLLGMNKALWDRIEAYRWENRIQSESEAMRRLLESALDALETKGKKKHKAP